MKQFYELYEGNEKVSALLTQLSWTNHLLIMSGCKSDEEREFYMLLAIYVIDFLDLPPRFKEKHLKKGLIEGMKKFILELGKDFTYVDEEYSIMVGGDGTKDREV